MQTYEIFEYKNQELAYFYKTSGTLISNEKEIKIIGPDGELMMDFKIDNLNDFIFPNKVIYDGKDLIIEERLIIELIYYKLSNTFIWTIMYNGGYAIFKTKQI